MEESLFQTYPTSAEKIPLINPRISMLKEYESRLMQKAKQAFGAKIGSLEMGAFFSYDLVSEAPSIMSLYLLCPGSANRYARSFFEEMIMSGFIENQPIRILSSQEILFGAQYFIEVIIYIRDEKQLSSIIENLPNFEEQIKRGALSHVSANQILQGKHLTQEKKNNLVYKNAKFLAQRFPKKFEFDFFRMLENFLFNIRPDFQEKRSASQLCRIICTFYIFQKTLTQASKAFPLRRHISIKLFPSKVHYPFGLKEVLGVIISLNSLSEYENFNHRHILRAIRRIIPLTELNNDSLYFHPNEQLSLLTFYLEIEKKDGTRFDLQEIKQLKRVLPQELKKSIEHLSASLFVPRNEEELMRNIIALSHELKYVRDIPQAIISFQEQKGDLLRFNVILLRILHNNSSSLQALAHHLPSQMRFIFERTSQIGFVRKKYVKEANVFILEVKNSLFFRENHSVDLVKARQFIVHAVEKMVGKFRDFNGGLLLKQNQRLEAIKRLLPTYIPYPSKSQFFKWMEDKQQYEFLFETLFYSLSPSIMQASLPPEEGASLFSLLLETFNHPISSKNDSLLTHRITETALAIVIKTTESHIKEQMTRVLSPLHFPPLKFAMGSLEFEGHSYLCYLLLDLSNNEKERLLKSLQGEIDEWQKKQQELQLIRLHLPRATQALDPRIATDRTSGAVLKMLYEGLMRTGANGKLEKGIAESFTLSPDEKVYTFKLKKTYWSNQAPLTAEDFVYSWKSLLDPQFASYYSFLFFPIKNAENAKRGKVSLDEVGIKAIDKDTLVVELEYPTAHFLEITASPLFSPLWHKIDKNYPGWAHYSERQYVCNGPFKLDKWKRNNDLTLVKNPLFWNSSSIKLDKIVLRVIEDEETAYNMFSRGELDWSGDPLSKIPIHHIPHLKKNKQLITEITRGCFWFQLNLQCQPFQSSKIRKSFSYAICRKALLDQLISHDDEPAMRFYSLNEDFASPDCNKKEALRLFEEGLLDLGLTREEISPICISHSEIDEHEIISYAVGKMWEELFGIKIEYERILWNSYFDKFMRRDFMVGGLTWYPRYNDPIYVFDLLAQNSNEAKITSWNNKKYIELVNRAKRIQNNEERRLLLLEAEAILLDEMPVIPVIYQNLRYIKNKRLENVHLSNHALIDFAHAHLTET